MGKATSNLYSKTFKIASRSGEKAGNNRTVAGVVGQKCCGRSEGYEESRFLQQVLCDSQERTRKVEVNFGLEQIGAKLHSSTRIQDGDGRGCSSCVRGRGVGNVAGLHRCLLPCAHTQEIQEVPQVLPLRTCVSVPSFAYGTLYGGSDLYQVDQGGEGVCAKIGCISSSIHRRLAGACKRSKDSSRSHKASEAHSRVARIRDKCEKVRADPKSRLCVSGPELQVGSGSSGSLR